MSDYHGVTGEWEGVISATLARGYKHLSDARPAIQIQIWLESRGEGSQTWVFAVIRFPLAGLSPRLAMSSPSHATHCHFANIKPELLVRVNIDPPHSSLKCFISCQSNPEWLDKPAFCLDYWRHYVLCCEALFVGIYHSVIFPIYPKVSALSRWRRQVTRFMLSPT